MRKTLSKCVSDVYVIYNKLVEVSHQYTMYCFKRMVMVTIS